MRKATKSFGIAVILLLLTGLSASASAELTVQPTSMTPQSSVGVPVYSAPGATPGARTSDAAGAEPMVSVIIQLKEGALAEYQGGIAGFAATSPKATGAERLDVNSLSSRNYLSYLSNKQNVFAAALNKALPTASIVNRYNIVFNGVSALVPADQVDALGHLPGVKAVFADELKQLNTERSPGFINTNTIWQRLGGKKKAGQGIVVGVIDTGIWPEHPSFSDPDPAGKAYPAPPSTWVGANCDFGSAVPADDPFTCNNKLIGATYNMATYAASGLLLPNEFLSARDDDGHGTHTAGTAAGNRKVASDIFGIPRGKLTGMAPRAHVAAYKACGSSGCFTSDLLDAINAAVADGVDVINYSIGGGASDPYIDPDALAFLNAYDAGVFVATSAGNSGPDPNTLGSPGNAPWITTVGASTTDRHFISTVTLTSTTSDSLVVKGASVTDGISGPTPIELAGGDGQCTDSMPGVTSGAIVVCDRGGFARVAKGFNAQNAGAGGMILRNLVLQGLATDNHFIPSVHVEFDVGQDIVDYINDNSDVMVTFTPGSATNVQGDVMAAFSSRGGSAYLTIKPDVTAPGVQILAGHTPLPATVDGGLPGELFQAIQGTSMSSPHVAGAGALLKDLYPNWTPSQIRSALMTTAKTNKIFKEDGATKASPFDMGSGRIDMDTAWTPGLTIDATVTDYLNHQFDPWNLNYPSIWHPNLQGRITVQRTLADVTGVDSTWGVSTKTPGSDWEIHVPRSLDVPAGGQVSFDIIIDGGHVPLGEVRHGEILMDQNWTARKLHIPVSFMRGQGNVKLAKSCDAEILRKGESTLCTITVQNNDAQDANIHLVDQIPSRMRLVSSSVVGADRLGRRLLSFDGILAGAVLPEIDIVQLPSPSGYVSLAGFGVTPSALPANCDDGGWVISGVNADYLGRTYTTAIWSVNGTLELGSASGLASSHVNSSLPDPALPNNLLAPWWTDLDLCAGGNWYVANLTDGTNSWDVFEWENVPRFGDAGSTFTFQIWLENGAENIYFTYGPSSGDATDGTTGAENGEGNVGDAYYFDGSGTSPWDDGGPDLQVVSVPGISGESHVISFEMKARKKGKWEICAEMTSDLTPEIAVACDGGRIK